MIVVILPQKLPGDKRLLRALNGEVTPQIPFWLMRQAGRYLPEYRQLREKAGSFLKLCFNPEFAAEVTLQPIHRFDMDAAILFSDILVVPYALGQELSFIEGEGPKLGPLGNINDLEKVDFSLFDKKLQPVYETIRRVRTELPADKALIGFAGAPWTIACYMVQGHGDGAFNTTKQFAFDNPEAFDGLIETLVTATSRYLLEQITSGVDVVQIFDSWAGLLPDPYFDRWVTEPTKKIVDRLHRQYPHFPVIGFPRGAAARYSKYAAESGVCCVGLDQGFSLEKAVQTFGQTVTLQGNLDPQLLLAGGSRLKEGVQSILKTAGQTPFIFNLGHGVIKETPPEHVLQLATILKEYQR